MDFIRKPKAMTRYLNRRRRSGYAQKIPLRVLQKNAAALYGIAAFMMDENHG